MPTITYKCDTCKRKITKLENIKGVTIFSKCIMTLGCHGHLYKISRNLDNIRENIPTSINSLIDYSPRKIFFKYFQNIPAKSWNIVHNLENSPSISVYISDIDGNINLLSQDEYISKIIDKNTINLLFKSKVRGTVHLISRNTTIIDTISTKNIEEFKVSNFGLITLAVPSTIVNRQPIPNIDMTNSTYGLEIAIKRPSEIENITFEKINLELDRRSSWFDSPKILVGKRRNYVVRTKSIFNFLAFGSDAKREDIPNGTRFKFNKILFPSSQEKIIESKELLMLLSNPPFNTIDKIRNKIIDIGELIDKNLSFVYKNGELYIDTNAIENTYPEIIKGK